MSVPSSRELVPHIFYETPKTWAPTELYQPFSFLPIRCGDQIAPQVTVTWYSLRILDVDQYPGIPYRGSRVLPKLCRHENLASSYLGEELACAIETFVGCLLTLQEVEALDAYLRQQKGWQVFDAHVYPLPINGLVCSADPPLRVSIPVPLCHVGTRYQRIELSEEDTWSLPFGVHGFFWEEDVHDHSPTHPDDTLPTPWHVRQHGDNPLATERPQSVFDWDAHKARIDRLIQSESSQGGQP